MKSIPKFRLCSLAILGILIILMVGCVKQDVETYPIYKPTVPTVSTATATNITQTTAASGGNVTSDGGAAVTARGICWSTASNPTILNNHSTDGFGTGIFTRNVAGLCANSVYYVRAYATNAAGTAYGNQVTFSTQQGTGATVTDLDGNVYHTVTIGTQVWMVENLKVTRYRNGDSIHNVSDSIQWRNLTTGAYCNYKNDSVIANAYGRLYNGYSVLDSRNICPCGWHIPNESEWTILTTYLGGVQVAGGKMKETGYTHWLYPNTGATNESGFTALGGGFRADYSSFGSLILYGSFWSSTEYSANLKYIYLVSDGTNIYWFESSDRGGLSVRCLKDN